MELFKCGGRGMFCNFNAAMCFKSGKHAAGTMFSVMGGIEKEGDVQRASRNA